MISLNYHLNRITFVVGRAGLFNLSASFKAQERTRPYFTRMLQDMSFIDDDREML